MRTACGGCSRKRAIACFAKRERTGRYDLVSLGSEGAIPDSVWVELGSDGLPSRVRSQVGDLRWTMRLSRWRFSAARGAQAFVIRPPAGYEVVDVP